MIPRKVKLPRTFIAMEVPETVRRLVARHIEFLRDVAPNARVSWVRPENLHLTLKFLGNVEPHQLPAIDAAASIENAANQVQDLA